NEKPKLRFPEFTDDWKTVKIGKIFDERVEKKYNDLELLSVTISNGVIKRSEIEDKDTSSSNKSNYKHVQKGDLVYNSMRMWQGASGISNYEGIVSPAYTVLIPKESINSKFYGYYFKKQEMLNEFQKYSQGLTSDTWNLKYPLISQIKVKKPPIEEQNKITELLNKLDQKIKNTKKYIKRNKEFKRSLISKMFC
ncbi:MAG: restriction endonuclease subunit S, partial [Methanosphaera sp.]|nr:restriction endonuclease subunit S [Methanosphaera sp.]